MGLRGEACILPVTCSPQNPRGSLTATVRSQQTLSLLGAHLRTGATTGDSLFCFSGLKSICSSLPVATRQATIISPLASASLFSVLWQPGWAPNLQSHFFLPCLDFASQCPPLVVRS